MAKTCLWWANSLKSFSPTTLQFWSEHYLKLKSKTLQKSLSKFLAHQWRDQIYHSLDVIDWCEGCMLLGMFKLPHLSFILADLLVILENFNIHLLYNLTSILFNIHLWYLNIYILDLTIDLSHRHFYLKMVNSCLEKITETCPRIEFLIKNRLDIRENTVDCGAIYDSSSSLSKEILNHSAVVALDSWLCRVLSLWLIKLLVWRYSLNLDGCIRLAVDSWL